MGEAAETVFFYFPFSLDPSRLFKMYFLRRNKELVAAVIQTFKGHVRSMLRHAAASTIIEYAYNDKAVLAQRLLLTDELYGNTYTICKVHTEQLTFRPNTSKSFSSDFAQFPAGKILKDLEN